MEYLCIQLHPEKLDNPDLDIRYELPDKVCQLAMGLADVEGDGYDYGEKENYLNIFFTISDIKKFWPVLKDYLYSNHILGNKLLEGAIITYHYDDENYKLLSHYDSAEEIDEIT